VNGSALYTQFDGVFFEKTRLSIITVLYREEGVSFNRIKEIIGGTDGGVFTHLQKLQEAGYLSQKKEISGSRAQTIYTLTRSGRKEFERYLRFMSEMLGARDTEGEGL
jgi:DNA-binding MarR family transcriptional regulator